MAKCIVEDCKRVSIKWLNRNGYLSCSYRWGGIEWTSVRKKKGVRSLFGGKWGYDPFWNNKKSPHKVRIFCW
jgi:hypothetical protein